MRQNQELNALLRDESEPHCNMDGLNPIRGSDQTARLSTMAARQDTPPLTLVGVGGNQGDSAIDRTKRKLDEREN